MGGSDAANAGTFGQSCVVSPLPEALSENHRLKDITLRESLNGQPLEMDAECEHRRQPAKRQIPE